MIDPVFREIRLNALHRGDSRTTNKRSLDNMNLKAFPHKNYYFNIGLESLEEVNGFCDTEADSIFVVNLNQWSLKDVVLSQCLENPDTGRIFLISASQYIPLANYYQMKNENIIAICQETESVKALRSLLHDKGVTQTDTSYKYPYLTEREFISLYYLFNGVNAHKQASFMGLCAKTVYTFRDKLAVKLQVKKLSHLLLPSYRAFR
ncbi:hypothetical protein JNO12_23945 [Erwinia aphidicola]|nr:hypothetical protein [Erwinia aphidicola]